VNVVGCGGLLHDLDVRWIQGYTKKIGTCDTFYAKMWGMYIRMDMACHSLGHLEGEK
jgi:hypothetical protein